MLQSWEGNRRSGRKQWQRYRRI